MDFQTFSADNTLEFEVRTNLVEDKDLVANHYFFGDYCLIFIYDEINLNDLLSPGSSYSEYENIEWALIDMRTGEEIEQSCFEFNRQKYPEELDRGKARERIYEPNNWFYKAGDWLKVQVSKSG